MRLAASLTFCTAGNNKPIRIAIMAITTSNSIKVKAFLFLNDRLNIERLSPVKWKYSCYIGNNEAGLKNDKIFENSWKIHYLVCVW